MRKFETLILLSPELASDSRDQVVNTLKEVIEREGGNVEEVDSWGMRDLAYPCALSTPAPTPWWQSSSATSVSPTKASTSS